MSILMQSSVYEVVKIKKRSGAKMFKDLQVGNTIRFSVPVAYAGSNRGRTYTTGIKVECLETGAVTYKTFNQLPPVLENFELVEVK